MKVDSIVSQSVKLVSHSEPVDSEYTIMYSLEIYYKCFFEICKAVE